MSLEEEPCLEGVAANVQTAPQPQFYWTNMSRIRGLCHWPFWELEIPEVTLRVSQAETPSGEKIYMFRAFVRYGCDRSALAQFMISGSNGGLRPIRSENSDYLLGFKQYVVQARNLPRSLREGLELLIHALERSKVR